MKLFLFGVQLKKHLVTASYVDESLSKLDEKAKHAGITVLGEMGLDPGIGKYALGKISPAYGNA